MPRLVAAALSLVMLTTASATRAPESEHARVHQLIARVLRAYGGAGALARVRAYRIDGSVFSSMRHEKAVTVRVFERPDRLKVLIEYDDGAEARIADGTQVWRNEHGGPLESADDAMQAAVQLQVLRAAMPWALIERESEVRIDRDAPPPEGVLEDGRPPRNLVAVSLPLAGGLLFRAWIDPSAHVVVSQGVMNRGGMETHFETVYDDFRPVEGVVFAFHEDNWASGMQTAVTTVDHVTVNPTLGVNDFRPPVIPANRGD